MEAEPPRPRPEEVLYHPRLGAAATVEEYFQGLGISLEEVMEGKRPVVGGWFFPVRWLDNDLAHVDAPIDEVEKQGCVPLFCFYRRVPLAGGNSKSTQWVLDNYFKKDGQVLIDVFISLMHFSLSLLRSQETHLPGYLNVIRLQAPELFADYAHWPDTFQAVSPLDICASYALPEVDGSLHSAPVATKETDARDPLTGAVLQRLRPIPERIAKVVHLARNRAVLRRKPNRGKKGGPDLP